MTQRLFRCGGDIQFDDSPPIQGQIVDVKLKPFSETCNYLQYQKPLTEKHPYFFAQIRSLCDNSVVSIGVAGPDIEDDVHPGNWNNTIGYRNTGRCFSSHWDGGNTVGEQYGIGDLFGVMLTYFGQKWSTAIFLKNGTPVATRYIFEDNHSLLLPTISLENGPIELGLMWPESVIGSPKFSERNLWQWIRPPRNVQYNSHDKSFSACSPLTTDTAIQSPVPLSRDIQHFEVIVQEVSPEGKGPVISIDSCSPMFPMPTSGLLNDFFRWVPDGNRMKTAVGERMGWGIFYNPALRDGEAFDDKAEQLVVCFVTINVKIVFAKMMVQPEGGFFPVVLLNSSSSRVVVDVESNRSVVNRQHLDDLYEQLLIEASAAILNDRRLRDITMDEFKMSDAFKVTVGETFTNVLLPRDRKGIHVLQYVVPLRRDASYFIVDIKRKGDSSVVCIGIADQDFPLNRYPGRLQNTVGYHSRDGKMYHNDKFNGNMTGQKYGKGDSIGVEVDMFGDDLSVILFRRNNRPVGTRFHSQRDHSKFLPTIAVCGNGSEVELNIVFQNRISSPPVFQVANVAHWCVPDRAHVDAVNNVISVDPGHSEVEAIQAPYSLDRNYNHFEVEFIDAFDDNTPPPAIALCTASPMDPPSPSNFRQDFLRFWATGEARKAVKQGDLMGWGQMYPDVSMVEGGDQLVICYLTINRDIVLTRVMYEPPGGFYPVVLLPVGVDRVKLNFGATIITEHPFTDDAIQQLLREAQQLIHIEKQRLQQGTEPEEWDTEENKGKYLKPVPITAANLHKFKEFKEKFNTNQLKGLRKRPSKIDNFVELMLEEDKANASSTPDSNDPDSPGDECAKSVVRADNLSSIRTSNPFVRAEDDSSHHDSNRESKSIVSNEDTTPTHKHKGAKPSQQRSGTSEPRDTRVTSLDASRQQTRQASRTCSIL